MSDSDELLARWIGERDPDRAFLLVETLVANHADPLVRRIVRSRLRFSSDADDVAQKALLALIVRLDRLKDENDTQALRDFDAYVSGIARNACHEYFRGKYPERHRLTLKLRYLARHSSAIALWEAEDGREVCGLARHRGRKPIEDPTNIQDRGRTPSASRASLEELTTSLLRAADAPILFDDLVEIVFGRLNLAEPRHHPVEAGEDENEPRQQLADPKPTMESRLTELEYLRQLWFEIGSLPMEQRRALLLNLNESIGGDLAVFDHLGIASVEEIGRVVGIPALAFAELWNHLPLDDARIARELGISAQAVANRRSSARQRLARRMRGAATENQKKMRTR
jgi:RNA polymerase sigma factor (sigma-70 family)